MYERILHGLVISDEGLICCLCATGDSSITLRHCYQTGIFYETLFFRMPVNVPRSVNKETVGDLVSVSKTAGGCDGKSLQRMARTLILHDLEFSLNSYSFFPLRAFITCTSVGTGYL